jgi:hypothetical protein
MALLATSAASQQLAGIANAPLQNADKYAIA